MQHRNYEVRARNRRFIVRIMSDVGGYYGRVWELVSDSLSERTAPVILNLPPRLEIGPGEFYRHRERYRAEFIQLVNAEVTAGRLHAHTVGSDHKTFDAFVKANLRGWPNGYPDATDDDFRVGVPFGVAAGKR